MSPDEKKYRRNVAVFVLDAEGQILVGRRNDEFKSWQLPQGGIDEGEELEAAMFRELEEEIGTREVDIIGALEQPIRYDWPEWLHDRGWHGQEQSYYLVRIHPAAKVDLNRHTTPEFDAVEWVGAAEFLNRAEGFKKDAYAAALRQFIERYPGMIAP